MPYILVLEKATVSKRGGRRADQERPTQNSVLYTVPQHLTLAGQAPIDVLVFKTQTPPGNLGLIHSAVGIHKVTSLENGRSDLKLEKGGHLEGPQSHENRVPPKARGVRL